MGRFQPFHLGPLDMVRRVRAAHVAPPLPKFDVRYTNSPLVVRLFREKGFRVEELPLLKREVYSGTQIRKLIYEGGDWAPLVPKAVSSYILEIDGPQRIRETFRYSTPSGTRETD